VFWNILAFNREIQTKLIIWLQNVELAMVPQYVQSFRSTQYLDQAGMFKSWYKTNSTGYDPKWLCVNWCLWLINAVKKDDDDMQNLKHCEQLKLGY
jgi:hypothetical protein